MSSDPLQTALDTIAAWKKTEPKVSDPNTAEHYEGEAKKLLRQIAVIEAGGESTTGQGLSALDDMREQVRELTRKMEGAGASDDSEKQERAAYLIDFRDACMLGMSKNADRAALKEALGSSPVTFGLMVDAYCAYAQARHELDSFGWIVRDAGYEWRNWKFRLPAGRLTREDQIPPGVTPGLLRDRIYVQTVTAEYIKKYKLPVLPSTVGELVASEKWEAGNYESKP